MKKVTSMALYGVLVFSAVLVVEMVIFAGLPPLPLALITLFIGFFFVGLLFGNLNAIAMQPLGKLAGIGAAIIGSLSSIISVPVAMGIDAFLTDNLYPIAIGFLIFFSLAKLVITPTLKAEPEPTES
ncbi:MAG: hypothetical protein GY923_11290 [Aestuariibacter sp.]|nr:hypothetical protein [Aestuariibacter sp.]